MATELHHGAALYVPGSHKDLTRIAAWEKLGAVRNVIICLEDAVAEHELANAYRNLAAALECMDHKRSGFARYVRPRDPRSLEQILKMRGIEAIDGFVLPKFDQANMASFLGLLSGGAHQAMPTLETADAFDDTRMRELAENLLSRWHQVALPVLRIGGNDLLALLRMRRPRGMTLYETPIGSVISSLVRIFKPLGFQLTSPVFEHYDDLHTLSRELKLDLAHGLCGKTAIHPNQVEIIESCFTASDEDISVATRVLDDSGGGVFRMHGSMCEPATHRQWAEDVLARTGGRRT